MPIARGETVTVRMSKDERAMLAQLADEDGLSASDVLRLLVRRAHTARFGDGKSAKKKAAKGRGRSAP